MKKVNHTLLDDLHYDTEPSSCIVIQVLHSAWFGMFTSKLKALQNHRVYRKDEVFLHPTLEDTARVKIIEQPNHTLPLAVLQMNNYHDAVRLVYHFGWFPSVTSDACQGEWTKMLAPECLGKHCYLQTGLIRQRSVLQCQIDTELPKDFQPIYFTTGMIELPVKEPDILLFSTVDLRSFSETFAWTKGSRSWMSSTMYYFNCSESSETIAVWSHLSTGLIDGVCQVKGYKAYSAEIQGGERFVGMKAPDFSLTDEDHSSVWTLRVSVKHWPPGILQQDSSHLHSFGALILTTWPFSKMCKGEPKIKNVIEKKTFQSLAMIQEGTRKSKDIINYVVLCITVATKVEVRWRELEIGFQAFDLSAISFKPSSTLRKALLALKKPPHISYSWQSHKYDHKMKKQFSKRTKLFRGIQETKWWSWNTALEECRRENLDLPSLEGKKFTRMFSSFIRDAFMFQTYSFYVGLWQKVSGRFCFIKNTTRSFQDSSWENIFFQNFQDNETKWVTRQPLIFYPWQPDAVMCARLHRMFVYGITGYNTDNYLFDSDSLTKQIITTRRRWSKKCYLLELSSPVEPTLKVILCNQLLLDAIICYNQSMEKLKPPDWIASVKAVEYGNDLILCTSGECVIFIHL